MAYGILPFPDSPPARMASNTECAGSASQIWKDSHPPNTFRWNLPILLLAVAAVQSLTVPAGNCHAFELFWVSTRMGKTSMHISISCMQLLANSKCSVCLLLLQALLSFTWS